MTGSSTRIRPIEATDEDSWRDLWSGYLTFYGAALPESTTDATWSNIIGDNGAFGGLVAEHEESGDIFGIANFILHPSTWSESSFCLLNDLFVHPNARGHGVGRALIQHLIELGRAEDWARIYWVTKEDNVVARTLYDSFAPADGFIRYSVATK